MYGKHLLSISITTQDLGSPPTNPDVQYCTITDNPEPGILQSVQMQKWASFIPPANSPYAMRFTEFEVTLGMDPKLLTNAIADLQAMAHPYSDWGRILFQHGFDRYADPSHAITERIHHEFTLEPDDAIAVALHYAPTVLTGGRFPAAICQVNGYYELVPKKGTV